MRRRRPSALYSVLDEEQLLGGVDLTGHPDPLTGHPDPLAGGPDDGSRGDQGAWGEWTPDDEDSRLTWSPEDLDPTVAWSPDHADAHQAWSPDDAGQADGGEADGLRAHPSPDRRGARSAGLSSRAPVGARRLGRLTLGFVGAAVVVLVIARGLGGVLAGVGERAGSRPAGGSPIVGALAAVSRGSAGSRAAQPAARVPSPPARRVRSVPAPRVLTRPARRVGSRPAPGTRSTSTPPPGYRSAAHAHERRARGGGGAEGREVGPSTPVRPADASGARQPPGPGRASSPEQEFGFER
jgi:hypothetical protein